MAGSKTISIPATTRATLNITIAGETPLLTHAWGPTAIAKMERDQSGAAKLKNPPRDPERDFREALYVINAEQERYGIPSTAVKNAMVAAGGRYTKEFMTELRGVVRVQGYLLEITGSKPIMDVRPCRINGGKTSDIRYRPMFWPWEIVVPISYTTTFISDAEVVNLLRLAGESVGIGDYRIESKGGQFGGFTIKEVQAA